MLSVQNIRLSAQASNKIEAIHMVAEALAQSGYVETEYVNAMLARDELISTYLGNGIAIPHGTIEYRDKVKKTGAYIFQFPQGIDWGEDDIAYVVIGMAACSNEHLELLRQLTHVLLDEQRAQSLWKTTDLQQFFEVISGQVNRQCEASHETRSNENKATDQNVVEEVFVVRHFHGLHTRPASLLAKEAQKYSSSIELQNLDRSEEIINGKSAIRISSLGAAQGHRLRVIACGCDAEQAITALGKIISLGLGE
ncbi:HPr family phosphocarrier protein [[Haemophilus] felis]|nr:HPr family phosphocarrier protein [[Haemophilus] felis]